MSTIRILRRAVELNFKRNILPAQGRLQFSWRKWLAIK